MLRQPMLNWLGRMLMLAAVLAVVGCAPYEKKPRLLDRQLTQLQLQRVAVLPVVYRDQPSDRYVAYNFAIELRQEAQRALEARGYEVFPASATGGWKFPHSYQISDPTPAGLAALAPAGADAVLMVWVDHFLDAGLGNGRGDDGDIAMGGGVGLDVYATADLVAVKAARKVWSAEGHGYEDPLAFPTQTYYLSVARLIDGLFATLPAGPAR